MARIYRVGTGSPLAASIARHAARPVCLACGRCASAYISQDVWPNHQALIARSDENGLFADAMAWGVPMTMPGKCPGTIVRKRVSNVRNMASPFWRSMLAKPAQRCLVPFTGFAELNPNASHEKVRFRVPSQPVSIFAGIWRASTEGNVFAFLTCEPNPLVASSHPKAMPVILQPEDYQGWLDGAPAQDLAQPSPLQLMELAET